MNSWRRLYVAVLSGMFLVAGCGGSGSGSSSPGIPSGTGGMARVRFAEGAPTLETIIDGVPTDIGAAYLRVDGSTLASSFNYGQMTQFLALGAGAHSVEALDESGYGVGPLKTAMLTAGKHYTLVLVGSYPNYNVLTFEEPASTSSGQLSLYEASPAVPTADFGSFRASSHADYKQLGSAKLGSIITVALAKSVSNFGGYVGRGSKPFTCGSPPVPCGAVTAAQVDGFDKKSVLPFHAAARLSLFLFDIGNSQGPVFGSLDR